MRNSNSGLRQQLGAVMGAVLVCASLSSFAGASEDRDYANAVQSYAAGRTSEAFGQFASLANRGDSDAARIALFMHAHGPQLYGKHWDALPQQIGKWGNLAKNTAQARSGQPFDASALQQSPPALNKIALVSR